MEQHYKNINSELVKQNAELKIQIQALQTEIILAKREASDERTKRLEADKQHCARILGYMKMFEKDLLHIDPEIEIYKEIHTADDDYSNRQTIYNQISSKSIQSIRTNGSRGRSSEIFHNLRRSIDARKSLNTITNSPTSLNGSARRSSCNSVQNMSLTDNSFEDVENEFMQQSLKNTSLNLDIIMETSDETKQEVSATVAEEQPKITTPMRKQRRNCQLFTKGENGLLPLRDIVNFDVSVEQIRFSNEDEQANGSHMLKVPSTSMNLSKNSCKFVKNIFLLLFY